MHWFWHVGLIVGTLPAAGTLPPSWGNSVASFPQLKQLTLYQLDVTGTLPPVWGTARNFEHLRSLFISKALITGKESLYCIKLDA